MKVAHKGNHPLIRCMNPHCPSRGKAEAKYRGLCEACYKALKRLLTASGLEWADAVRAGKCTERNRPGRKPGLNRFPDFPAKRLRATKERGLPV